MQIHRPVTMLIPAMIDSVAQLKRSVAVYRGFRFDNAFFQSGRRHNQLVGGAGRILPGNRFVGQRIQWIFQQFQPFIACNAAVEHIRIIRRQADHRQNGTVSRIHRHSRSGKAPESFPGRLLQIQINRQNNIGAGHRINPSQALNDLAAGIDFNQLVSPASADVGVINFFDTGLARNIAKCIFFRLLQFLFADLARVADNRRKEFSILIKPDRCHIHIYTRQIHGIRFHQGHLLHTDIFFQPNGQIGFETLRKRLIGRIINRPGFINVLYFLHERFGIDTFCRHIQHIKGGTVLRDDSAVAVHHQAPQRLDFAKSNRIVLRPLLELIPLDHLQMPEANRQNQQSQANQHHDDVKFLAKLRRSRSVAEFVLFFHIVNLLSCSSHRKSRRREHWSVKPVKPERAAYRPSDHIETRGHKAKRAPAIPKENKPD